jgi:hypothetical protein
MMRSFRRFTLLTAAGLVVAIGAGCARHAAPETFPSPAAQQRAAAPQSATGGAGAAGDTTAAGRSAPGQPRPYNRVITSEARTQSGLFKTHRIAEKLFFEIPRAELGREMLVVQRTVAGGNQSGFFGGGPTRVVIWERGEGNRILLRQTVHSITADTATAIFQAVEAQRMGPIIASFNIEAFGPDSAAVIDVTRLYTTNIPEFAGLTGV